MYRIDPKLDPAACNALTQTASGLLVPGTEVTGIAPGTAVGTSRSVDVDVTAPAAGACPETWTVGARLTPVFGTVNAGTADLRTSAMGQQVPLPNSQVVLPEPGVYRLTAHVFGLATWNFNGRHIASINALWINTATNAFVPGSPRKVLLHDEPGTVNPETGLKSIGGNAVCEGYVTITAPTTYEVRGLRATGDGNTLANANLQHYLSSTTNQQGILWQKVSD
ncbi:hypothetical protein PV518_37610 [Streptomyces sp. ND04-05B]|uniref:hypothetical protein n=1 Tax=Streptomyces sp. ND04-05B TaxID=3028693 RepID=UPI0029B17B58|nr:hypothetical protein [Streptomyces sp. ND04-05B]MDX3067814.1 hypothetical protein [Streptomyces sp. ND04-05B]